MAAINNFGGFYRTEVYIHEARMAGGVIHNPCVNHSQALTDVEGKDVWLGFIHLKGLASEIRHAVPTNRSQRGPFQSLEDFIHRISIAMEQLQLLINVGAFRFTGKSKGELTLQARLLLKNLDQDKLRGTPTLFEEPARTFEVPVLDHGEFEDVFDELELLQFPVSKSPYELLQDQNHGATRVADFLQREGQRVEMVAYLLSRKPVPAVNGNMSFGTWIDIAGEYFDTVHFPDVLERFPFNAPGCYRIWGKVVVEYDFPMIEVSRCEHQPIIADPRYEESDTRLPVGRRDNVPFVLGRKAYPGAKERKVRFGN